MAVILLTLKLSKFQEFFLKFDLTLFALSFYFRYLPKVLDAFVQLLQEADCSLESLSLVDSKLRSETSIILNALGSNQSLINIDVSGKMSFN